MEQLIGAFLKWLEEAGFTAVRRLPQGVFPQIRGTVVAVGVEQAEAKAAGFFSYLGMTQRDGKEVSLYGKRLEAEISLEVVSPETIGAAACMQEADKILTKLSGGIGGLTLTKITAGVCSYDAAGAYYSCRVTAKAEGYLYALSNEEETEFTDFMLKGEAK